jgi:hypothetical protein
MSEPISSIVECMSRLFVEHPIGHAVTECVWCHIVCVATTPVDLPWLNAGGLSDRVEHIPNAPLGDPVGIPGWE